MAIEVISVRCIGCGICVDVCPNEALVMQDGRTTLVAVLCEGCGVCVGFCEQKALELPQQTGEETPGSNHSAESISAAVNPD